MNREQIYQAFMAWAALNEAPYPNGASFHAGFHAGWEAALRSQPQCSYCGGNDSDMPCAYPGDKVSGCLRDRRLAAPPADGVPRAGVLVPEGKLAALQSDLAEQCRLNAMGQEREARLMAQLQEAERKLAEAERSALERALKACNEVAANPSSMWEEAGCWEHAAENCENAIRALMKEGDENV